MSTPAVHDFGELLDLPVVVGGDGSGPSPRAVDWAADRAALRGASLRLVYAPLWERYEGTSVASGLGKPSQEVAEIAHRVHPGARARIALGVGHKPVGSAAVRIAVGEAVLRGGPQEAVRAWRRPLHHGLQTQRRTVEGHAGGVPCGRPARRRRPATPAPLRPPTGPRRPWRAPP